jgi:hypothetical protein
MADRAIEVLNDRLRIFNRESGPYLELVGDATRATPVFSSEVKINDINTGAVSNVVEYLRRFAVFLILQLDLSQASGDWLDYIAELAYSMVRGYGETDAQFFYRIESTIFSNGPSPISIEDALAPYATLVQVIEGIDDGAFSEVSFTECYRNFDSPQIVKAAIAGQEGGMPFFFRVIMVGADPTKARLILDTIMRLKAAGVSFVVELL